MAIPSRPLGSTGIEVSILGYGAMELRGEPRSPAIDDTVAEQLLNSALDAGINLLDTSIDYGRSEELIGRYVGHRRDEFVLASKCGCILDDPGNTVLPTHDYSDVNLRAGIEQSLRRLKTDHLDILQVHMSPSGAQLEESQTIETLVAAREEGKVRFIGMSGTLPNLRDHIAMGVFDVFQIPYSIVQRDHETVIERAAATGAGILIRGGAARGAPSEEKRWASGPIGLPEGEGLRRWEHSNVRELLGGMDEVEFVLRFTLSNPNVSSTIVGTSNPAHLRANIGIAKKGALPADLYSAARRHTDLTTGAP